MQYTQRNPVPMPDGGPFRSVRSTIDTIFDWQYALDERKLMALYEKGTRLQWRAEDLDWSTDVDIERMARENDTASFMNDVMKTPKRLSMDDAVAFRLHSVAFMLSQFLHGEQGALIASARIVQSVPWEEAKFYAANQVADEARHVEVYHRYLTEKLEVSYPVHPQLQTLLDQIVEDSRWDITYLGMQILVEGLALAAFGTMRITMPNEPLLLDITDRIMADEARHVAFGVLSLQKLYEGEFSAAERREREEFVIEAIHLLHGRLLMDPVFERLGYDVPMWSAWNQQNAFQKGFRQMMFQKIVPNLRRLGLLSGAVRDALAKLDLLHFADGKDSVEEPGIAPPEELIALMNDYLGTGGDGQNPDGSLHIVP
ncbi:MAG: ferritin-like domain-containing protein [bacterium]